MLNFVINGKGYIAKDLGFDAMCVFEQLGAPIELLAERGMSTIRAYFVYCSGLTTEEATEEIESHVMNDGSLEALSGAFAEKLLESRFFQKMMGQSQKKTPSKKTPSKKADNSTSGNEEMNASL